MAGRADSKLSRRRVPSIERQHIPYVGRKESVMSGEAFTCMGLCESRVEGETFEFKTVENRFSCTELQKYACAISNDFMLR